MPTLQKLTLQINGESLREQNKVFIEIGRLCYDENRDNPGESYAPLFDELKAMDDRIETMREELEAARPLLRPEKRRRIRRVLRH